MDYRFIQIMPAPDNMYVVCQWGNRDENGKLLTDANGRFQFDMTEERVVCLALVEDIPGHTSVTPLIFNNDGEIEPPEWYTDIVYK